MSEDSLPCAVEDVILTVRGQRVIFDADLAALHWVTTRTLNQAVKRNAVRFPPEFAFVLAREEVMNLRSQSVTSSLQPIANEQVDYNRSQIVIGSQRHRDPKSLPIAFTEHGAMMAATVLRSPKAVEMSVFIVKAFVRMRQALMSRNDLEKRLAQIEKILLVHDDGLRDLYEKIRPLLLPPPEPPPKPIGFSVRERHAQYRVRRKPRQ